MMPRFKLLATLALLASLLATQALAQVEGNRSLGNAAPAASNIYYQQQQQQQQYQYYSGGNNALPSRGPASSATVTNPNLLTITVNGLMNIVASEYVAMFNIVQTGTEISETDDMMNARIKHFKHKLSIVGIDSSKVKVDMISFVPRYTLEAENKVFSKSNNEVPAGFELQKNVTVHFTQSSKLDDIISAAAQAEIYDIVKVDYFVSNIEAAYDTLMNACMTEVKERVKLHEGLGFRLDTVRKAVADNFATVFPSQRYYSYQAFSRPNLPTRKNGTPIKLNEADKTYSRYYNQIELDHYDLVIHPVITEPVVQLSYSIQVQYFLNDPKPTTPPSNNYYILTPSGDLKQIFPTK